MSSGAVIKEGSVGRKFRPVDKLQINNQGGTNSLWRRVVEMDSKIITENGFYLAKKDSLYAYDEVVVNVTMLSEAEKKMGKTITGIDPTTGNPVSVGVDDDGNLTEETLPDHIHIVIAPTKKKYSHSGETIDFSGIHVYLMNADNTVFQNEDYTTGEIPFDELIFPQTTTDSGSQQGGDGSFYTNGGGLHCGLYVYSETMRGMYGTFYYSPTASGYINDWTDWDDGDVYHAIEENVNGSAYLTRHFNEERNFMELFGYSIDCGDVYTLMVQPSSSLNAYIGSFLQGYWKSQGGVDTEFSYIPESTVDPTTITDMSNLYNESPASDNVPVQWKRSDGETLEDTFEITIGSSSSSSSGSSSGDSSGTSSGGEHSGGDF